MNKENFLKARAEILEALGDYAIENEENSVGVIYGFDEEGKQGWLIIENDYPSWTLYSIGETFEAALTEAKRIGDEEAA